MTKPIGPMAILSILALLALPLQALAAPPNKPGSGSGGHPAPHVSGGGGGTPRISGGGGGHPTFHAFSRSNGGGGSHPNFRAFSRSGGSQPSVRSFTSRHSNTINQNAINNSSSLSRSARRLHGTTQPNISSTVRSNSQTRLSQTARQGRFASTFAGRNNARVAGLAAHRAWRRGFRAGFVPWYGPVFWPYAYSDLFDYAFWPDGYDDGYWFYAYDDFFDGVFWGDFSPPEYYATTPSVSSQRVTYAAVEELCVQPGSGVTAWPFADIERTVDLSDQQKQLLNDVRKAGSDAAASFKASCPAESAFPLTPPGRLAAMTARINATLQAVQTVRPPLEAFYNSLSDEQKERFNRIGPAKETANPEAAQASADAKTCKDPKPGLTNLPVERIANAVKTTDAQQASLNELQSATDKAVSILQAACPGETPLTPPGRLAAMETRLKAMVEAANTVKPALESFYGSLSSEQKARFNRVGRDPAQTSSND